MAIAGYCGDHDGDMMGTMAETTEVEQGGNRGVQGPMVAVWWLCSRETRKCTNLLHSNKACVTIWTVAVHKAMFWTRYPGSLSNKNYLLFVHFRGSGCSHDLHSCGQAMSGQKTFLILRKRNLSRTRRARTRDGSILSASRPGFNSGEGNVGVQHRQPNVRLSHSK